MTDTSGDAGELVIDPDGPQGPLPAITIRVHRFASLVCAVAFIAFAVGYYVRGAT